MTLSTLKILTAKAFEPLLKPARYKGVYGGRGSGKSHFFGELLVETCQAERGTLAVCIREAQRTLAQSSKRLVEGKIASLGLGQGFRTFSDKIETPGDGVAANNITGKRYEDHLREAGFAVEPPVKNQGRGAAMMRIEALRRLGSQIPAATSWSFCAGIVPDLSAGGTL